jgi:peptidoglycan/LPS O-acetylase OafA/YrhL
MPRLDALTGLRWWAAFFVFAFHMLILAPLPGISSLLAQGYLGVTFFFVLSGFVLTWSASNRVRQSTFYWRRFARIYPSHFAALLIAIPVFYDLGVGHNESWVKPADFGAFGLSVLLIQGWWLLPSILFAGNPAAWTLTCEFFFYALHPYLSKALRPLAVRGAVVAAIGAVVVAFCYRAIAMGEPTAWYAALPVPLVHLPEFVLGMAIAWAFRNGWHPRVPVSVGIGAMAATVGAIGLTPILLPGSLVSSFITGFGNELFTVACALAIIAVARRSIEGKRLHLGARWQVVLGEWSFAFYLVHATFIYIALTVFGFQAPSWWNLLWFVGLLVVSLGAAAALHLGVEKPLEKRMRAWKDRKDSLSSRGHVDPMLPQRPSTVVTGVNVAYEAPAVLAEAQKQVSVIDKSLDDLADRVRSGLDDRKLAAGSASDEVSDLGKDMADDDATRGHSLAGGNSV